MRDGRAKTRLHCTDQGTHRLHADPEVGHHVEGLRHGLLAPGVHIEANCAWSSHLVDKPPIVYNETLAASVGNRCWSGSRRRCRRNETLAKRNTTVLRVITLIPSTTQSRWRVSAKCCRRCPPVKKRLDFHLLYKADVDQEVVTLLFLDFPNSFPAVFSPRRVMWIFPRISTTVVMGCLFSNVFVIYTTTKSQGSVGQRTSRLKLALAGFLVPVPGRIFAPKQKRHHILAAAARHEAVPLHRPFT